MREVTAAAGIVLLLAAGCGGGTKTSAFQTAKVKRGDIYAMISATGTVEPEEVVDVGAQIAGQLIAFGKDVDGNQVDYRSVVKKDMVLAKIDPSVYKAAESSAAAQLEQAQAQVLQANANVLTAKANLLQNNAKLDQAKADWERAQKLMKVSPDALAQTAYDQYKANYEVAGANVEVAKASIEVAKAAVTQADASVSQARASLDLAQRNLAFCTITSPVDGTVISRRVNIGQTVVSSLNAPSLFLLAKDLTKMEVWVAVNEADIGSIFPGQPVKFSVDAFQGKIFDGKVGKVRLNATMTQNVVTYTVEVTTDNSDGKLLPYLTANAKFETGHREKVLMVPNAALRWKPTAAQKSPAAADASGGESSGAASEKADDSASAEKPAAAKKGGKPAKTDAPAEDAEASAGPHGRGTIWVPDGAYARGIRVQTGLSDGATTEISAEGLTEGMDVITGDTQSGASSGGAASAGGTTNPFVPQMPAKKRSGR